MLKAKLSGIPAAHLIDAVLDRLLAPLHKRRRDVPVLAQRRFTNAAAKAAAAVTDAVSARPGDSRTTAIHVRRDKAALFQRVQAPPGDRSSRKQPEQAWRRRNV